MSLGVSGCQVAWVSCMLLCSFDETFRSLSFSNDPIECRVQQGKNRHPTPEFGWIMMQSMSVPRAFVLFSIQPASTSQVSSSIRGPTISVPDTPWDIRRLPLVRTRTQRPRRGWFMGVVHAPLYNHSILL